MLNKLLKTTGLEIQNANTNGKKSRLEIQNANKSNKSKKGGKDHKYHTLPRIVTKHN